MDSEQEWGGAALHSGLKEHSGLTALASERKSQGPSTPHLCACEQALVCFSVKWDSITCLL